MFEKLFKNLSHAQFGILIAMLAVLLASLVVGILISTKKKEAFKTFVFCAFGTLGALFIALLVIEFTETYRDGALDLWNDFGLYICTIAIMAVIATLTFIFGKKKECSDTKMLAYAAISIATSFALSYVKLFSLPQGGSVTLVSFLPLMLFSYMFGVRKGVLVGVIYGIMQFIQSPWFVHPMQFLVEYPVAFSAVGLAGLLHERKILDKYMPVQFAISGVIVAVIRYLAHVIAGIFVWGSSDPSYGVVAWSFLYNAFVFVDMALTIVVGCILTASKSVRTMMDKAPL